MKKIFIVFALMLVALTNVNAQKEIQPNNVADLLRAPHSTRMNVPMDPSVEAYNSRFFGVGLVGTTAVVKSFLNTPTTLTTVAATTRSIFAGALSGTGVWYGLEYLAAGSGNLVTIDTTTGNITTVAPLSGLSAGHTVTGLSWDKTSSTMYALSTNGTTGTLYTINLTTAAMATVGSTTGSSLPIDMSFSNSGILYSVDIGTDVLQTLNKTTGAATTVGPLGVNLNFAQGMCVDPSTDSLFLAAYNATTSSGQLLRCNTSTGATTLIGNLGSVSTELDGFVIPGVGLPALPLNPFTLQSPAAGTRIVTQLGSTTPVTISWDTSSRGATYKFVFGSPTIATRRLTIDNGGSATISTTLGALDAILAANGFTNNGSATDSAVGEWTVWAKKGPGASGADSLSASNGPRSITFRRGQLTLAPLNQDFASTTFPPPLWSLEGTGTMYWTRNAVGGYQVGSGSAKYDFYSAVTTTPLQSLVSQEFLPVTSPTNYLRFNYSHAGYVFTTTGLGPDSCIIETSTNNGSTWTVLLRMGAATVPVGGYNSSTVMSTQPPLSTGAYTPSAASMWATKILSMPVGTNKVRFTAKSGYGNNLYIDDITSGPMTGTQTPITLTPEKFELSQNYPNPFNPSTSIKYSIPSSSVVTLKIYNALGKEVATLVNENKPAGSYELNFDATNLSSGVYFYKIEAGNFSDIKRMVLIK